MVREVGITQQRLITPSIREVTPINGGQVITQAVGDFAHQVGGQIAAQAEKNYRLRVQAEMKGQIARIERENLDNPERMQAALASYHDDLIESVPIKAMEVEVSQSFGVQAAPSINRAFAAKRKAIDSQTEEQVLFSIDNAQNSMLNLAPSLFVDAEAGAEGNRQLALSVLKREGGFVNDPVDRGGATNFGITQATLSAVRGKKVSVQDVKDLTQVEAADILIKNYMEKPGFDRLPDHVKSQAFDMAVNHGPKNAIRILQEAAGVKKTGKLDTATKAALLDADPQRIKEARVKFYNAIVKNDPSQRKFLKGWLNRAEDAANEAPPLRGNETAIVAAQTVQQQMLDIQNALNVTRADGTPIFTAQQRVAKTLAARDALFQTAAETWMQQQPNKFEAYQKWQDGKVKIAFPDDKGQMQELNIRDTIPADVKSKIDDDFMSAIKDEISLENAIEAKKEKEFEETSKAIETQLIERMQNGEDIIKDVESFKNNLDSDAYTDLRKMALQAEPINNEQVYGDLLRRAYAGEDITAEANAARFSDNKIDNRSYVELVKLSQARTEGIKDPIEVGRKFLIDGLGGLSKDLGAQGSFAIARAKREYDEIIEDFRRKEERFPTQREAFEIADKILPHWRMVGVNEYAETIRKPRFMTVTEKGMIAQTRGNLMTDERMKEITKKTQSYFLQKHGMKKGVQYTKEQIQAFKEAAASDIEFDMEMEAIQKMQDIFKNAQKKAKDRGN